MSKEMTVIVLGLWVVVVPYLGIPGEWRTALLVLSGLGIAVVGFLLRGETLSRGSKPHAHNSFVESNQPAQPQPSLAHEHHEEIRTFN